LIKIKKSKHLLLQISILSETIFQFAL